MSDTVDALLLDLAASIAREERSYGEVMVAWGTSCVRLPVWEEADACGLVTRKRRRDGSTIVAMRPSGRVFLSQRSPQ